MESQAPVRFLRLARGPHSIVSARTSSAWRWRQVRQVRGDVAGQFVQGPVEGRWALSFLRRSGRVAVSSSVRCIVARAWQSASNGHWFRRSGLEIRGGVHGVTLLSVDRCDTCMNALRWVEAKLNLHLPAGHHQAGNRLGLVVRLRARGDLTAMPVKALSWACRQLLRFSRRRWSGPASS